MMYDDAYRDTQQLVVCGIYSVVPIIIWFLFLTQLTPAFTLPIPIHYMIITLVSLGLGALFGFVIYSGVTVIIAMSMSFYKNFTYAKSKYDQKIEK